MLLSSKRLSTGVDETGKAQFVETANFNLPSSGMGLPVGSSVSNIASPAIELPLLDGYISPDKMSTNRLYREIYYNDSISGSAVDLLSTLPFSDFSLVGLNNEKRLLKFAQSVEKIKARQLMPVLSVDYLVIGTFIGTLNWSERDKYYDAILPQNVDFCLTGDTRVLTDKGWQTIFEMAQPYEPNNFPINYQVDGKLYSGTAPFCTGKKNVFKLTMANGVELRGTGNHPVLCMRSDPDAAEWEKSAGRKRIPTWVNIDDLQVGDKVVVNDAKPVKTKKNLEFYESFFLGALMGDGTVSPSSLGDFIPTMVIFNHKNDIVKALKKAKVVEKITPTTDRSHPGLQGFRIVFNSRAREIMARQKYLNKVTCRIDNPTQLMGYLSGLIMTDGWIQSSSIHLAGGESYIKELRDYLIQYGYPHLAMASRIPDGEVRKIYKNGVDLNDYQNRKVMCSLSIKKASVRRMVSNLCLYGGKRTKVATMMAVSDGRATQVTATTTLVSKERAGATWTYDITVPEVHKFVANGIVVHNCSFEHVPIFGADPIVTLAFPDEIRKALTSNDDRMKSWMQKIPERVRNQLMSPKGFRLDPEDLIYISRPGTIADTEGVSIFRRVLPIWLMEKALIRGTLNQVWKRQRPILHISMGDPEWTATEDDYKSIVNLFLQADHDPTGAIVATRDGVNLNEVRRGEDFWKYPDIYEWAASAKLKALGINEQFLSGDGTINNIENSISVTLQHFSNYRARITRELFYERTFPNIAKFNGYTRSKETVVLSSYNDGDHYEETAYTEHGFKREKDGTFTAEISSSKNSDILDPTKYEMPQVHWHNSLKPDSSQEYMGMLTTLEEKGVPIPLRMWAAAGGLSIRGLAEQQRSDEKIRNEFAPWVKGIKKFRQNIEGEDGGGFEGASSVGSSPVGIMNREFDDTLDPTGRNHKGRMVPLSAKRKKEINESVNRKIAETAANQHEAKNYVQKEKEKRNRKRTYSFVGK